MTREVLPENNQFPESGVAELLGTSTLKRGELLLPAHRCTATGLPACTLLRRYRKVEN
jgi:hypothetical protein